MTAKALRVLFITHGYPISGDGPRANSLNLLADALAAQGVEVRVVAPNMRAGESTGEDETRVKRFRVASKPANSRVPGLPASAATVDGGRGEEAAQATPPGGTPRVGSTSRKAAMNYLGAGFGSAVMVRRDFEPDIVHAHWWFPSGLVGSWVSSLASLPLVTSLHGMDPDSGRVGSPLRPLFRHVVNRSAAVTVDSATESVRLAEVLEGVKPVIAPLPISGELFKPADSKADLVAVVVDGVEEEQLAELVRVVNALRIRGKAVALLSGSDADEVLLRRVLGAGTGGGVGSIVDVRDQQALARTLSEAQMCVVTGEGTERGAVISAAMLAAATPVFVGLSGGSTGDVHGDSAHPKVSIRLAGATSEEVVSQLLALGDGGSSLRQHGDAARMYALATLAPESCAARLLGVYLRAIEETAA